MASLPVLTFHAVDDRPAVMSFRPRLFEYGMALLYDRGFRTLSLPEVVEHLQQRLPFPERSFTITFDDGYQSVYEHAFPILRRYGFSATVFLAVGENGYRSVEERLPSMCERSMLSWREIKEMHNCGMTFGAHTLTHSDLTRLPWEQLEREIRESKVVIEDALGVSAASFAYPYGRYDVRCLDIVRRYFLCACSDTLGLVRLKSDFYALERVDSYYLRHEKFFDAISTRFFPLYISARAVPRRFRRAVEPRMALGLGK